MAKLDEKTANSILEVAKKVLKDHPEYFEDSLGGEKVRELQKFGNKRRFNFTIDQDLMTDFREFCSEKSLKMSSLVEKFIADYLNNNKKIINTDKNNINLSSENVEDNNKNQSEKHLM